ncbi:spore protease YyaC [Ureibacillus thermophilus]|uniref:Spore protease YyaC n=1 Tax=Ureibacillus thermophilus TaxID=367743 RepID=A0A4V1A2T1_9BACL|nr:spore protease YyaC [Ureibacillus thermophilus]QBK24830.1 spore protease YyaC [Ureibacillus thermophilus]
MQNTPQEPLKMTIHYEEAGAVWRLSDLFLEHIPFDHENLVFCCIGTDRSTGDALGPLTGSILSNSQFPFRIIGTLENPLHAINLALTVEELQQMTTTPFVVAIDACLGRQKSIGQIIVEQGPLFPGKAVNKELPPIGDISIKGVVNVGGFLEMLVLQNTRLHITYSMSHKIARALSLAYQRHLLKRKEYGNHDRNDHNAREQIRYSNFG